MQTYLNKFGFNHPISQNMNPSFCTSCLIVPLIVLLNSSVLRVYCLIGICVYNSINLGDKEFKPLIIKKQLCRCKSCFTANKFFGKVRAIRSSLLAWVFSLYFLKTKFISSSINKHSFTTFL